MATRRVQMDLPEKSFDRLKELKDKLEATSYSEIMKDAIRLYEYFVEMDFEGTKFFVEKKGEESKEIKLFI